MCRWSGKERIRVKQYSDCQAQGRVDTMKRKEKVAAAQVAAGEKRIWVDESEPQSETFSVEEDVNDLDSSPDYQVRHNSSLHRSQRNLK
jgi:hypothetical protein